MNNRIINLAAFAILTLLWLAFAAAMLFNQVLLEAAWVSFRSWPLVVQLLAGLLFLPVVAGLWVWQTTWPLILRLVLIAGLAWATVYTFYPRKARNQPAYTEEST